MGELPPQIQNMLAQVQQIQQQLQAIMTQRMQVEALLKEVEEALNEVNKAKEDTMIFKLAGNILVKAGKDEVVKELEDKKETYQVRINTLRRQEDKLKERFSELQKKIQSMLSPQAG